MVGFERKVARRSPNILKMLSAKANNTTDLISCYRFQGCKPELSASGIAKRSIAFRLCGRLRPQARLFEIAVKEVSAGCYIDTTSSAQQRTHPAPQY
jgi:hypothetical protein